jgi:hypothetical protein
MSELEHEGIVEVWYDAFADYLRSTNTDTAVAAVAVETIPRY